MNVDTEYTELMRILLDYDFNGKLPKGTQRLFRGEVYDSTETADFILENMWKDGEFVVGAASSFSGKAQIAKHYWDFWGDVRRSGNVVVRNMYVLEINDTKKAVEKVGYGYPDAYEVIFPHGRRFKVRGVEFHIDETTGNLYMVTKMEMQNEK